MNANDAAATAKHTDLTAAKILFAQTAKGQDVLTDDNALVARLRYVAEDMINTICDEAADRIEAQAEELEDQSKQIASQMNVIYDISAEVQNLRELLAAAYIELSGKDEHASDCATSNAPAMMPGRCDCD